MFGVYLTPNPASDSQHCTAWQIGVTIPTSESPLLPPLQGLIRVQLCVLGKAQSARRLSPSPEGRRPPAFPDPTLPWSTPIDFLAIRVGQLLWGR